MRRPSREEAEEAVRTLICWAGDDPNREGVLETPARVAQSYLEKYSGYHGHADLVVEAAPLTGNGGTILSRNIPFFSHCEHHMVPFLGVVHVAYGLSKAVASESDLQVLVDRYARRLQSQETLTSQILAEIERALSPEGAAVLVESEHLCMTIRGIHKHGATTVTTQFSGAYRDDPCERERVLRLLLGIDDKSTPVAAEASR